MQINISDRTVANWVGDGCAIAVFQTEDDQKSKLTTELDALDQKIFAGTLAELVTETEFKGKAGSTVSARVGGNSPIRKVLLIGLGNPTKATEDTWRVAAAQAGKWANQSKCKTLALAFPPYNFEEAISAQIISEGLILGLHQDKRFKSEEHGKNTETLEQIDLLDFSSDAKQGIDLAKQVCSGVILARELVSAPANLVTPTTLAETALAIAKDYKDTMSVEILEKAQCEALGMGAFLGVAQASDLPPKFIHLTYKHGTAEKKLAIVGKGVTFDSGGLNIKAGAGSGIEMMKTDMGGAAAALGTAKAIAQLRPANLEVHFIVAACENMISGTAMHPGDILTAGNGKTIEVNNTDAEGRLTLADALVFADRLGVDAIVDLATLTGAIVVALGTRMSGFWSTNESLAQQIEVSAKSAGEKFWRMPLEEVYWDNMKSVVADFKNTGNREAGSITGALFLKQFVETTSAWAHLDIAGPVWTDKESGYDNAGGTGFPVRTLVNLIMGFQPDSQNSLSA
jgi:leucyl aminopeptidase